MSQAVRKQENVSTVPSVQQSHKHAQTAMPSTLATKRQVQQAEQHELLVREFGLVASAPSGIKKLREMILALAIRGKLVPQNFKDVPACKVFGSIASTSGKSQLKEVTEHDVPYDAPKGWLWMRLGIATSFGSNEKAGRLHSETWVLDLEDIEKDTSKLLRKLRYAERPAKSEKNLFHSGDVLYGKLRPYLNKVIVADENGACTTEILPIRWSARGDPKFLMYALKSPDFLVYVNSKSYGMKMPRLGTMDGRNALIPVPPVEEQKRIASKIDELMALCDRMEGQQADAEDAHKTLVKTLLDALTQSQNVADFNASWTRISENFDILFNTEASIDAFKQTVLQLAVTGFLSEQSIPVIDESINDICKLIDGDRGAKYPKSHDYLPKGYCLFLSTKNVRSNGFKFDALMFINEEKHRELRNGTLCRDDVVITTRGTLGNVAVYDETVPYEVIRINSGMLILRPEKTLITPAYLSLFIQSPVFFFQLNARRSGSAQQQIPAGILKTFSIQLPPLSEQHRIVAKVDELMAICDTLKARITESKTLHERLADTLVKQGK